MNDLIKLLGMIVLIVFLIAIGPLLILWSLNTLFPALAIEYTVWTWLAALILASAVKAKVTVNK